MMRRLFFRNAAIGAVAAPIAATAMGKDVFTPQLPEISPAPHKYRGFDKVGAEQAFDPLAAIKQAKRMDYNKSMSEIRRIHNNIHGRRHILNQLDLNINSLKSVSMQHKAIMQQEVFRCMEEERRSWKDKLLIQFGLKREDVYDEEPQAASGFY